MALAQHCEVLSVRGYVYLIIEQNFYITGTEGSQILLLHSCRCIFATWKSAGNQQLRVIGNRFWENSQNYIGSSKVWTVGKWGKKKVHSVSFKKQLKLM